jgi:hypothetical protein
VSFMDQLALKAAQDKVASFAAAAASMAPTGGLWSRLLGGLGGGAKLLGAAGLGLAGGLGARALLNRKPQPQTQPAGAPPLPGQPPLPNDPTASIMKQSALRKRAIDIDLTPDDYTMNPAQPNPSAGTAMAKARPRGTKRPPWAEQAVPPPQGHNLPPTLGMLGRQAAGMGQRLPSSMPLYALGGAAAGGLFGTEGGAARGAGAGAGLALGGEVGALAGAGAGMGLGKLLRARATSYPGLMGAGAVLGGLGGSIYGAHKGHQLTKKWQDKKWQDKKSASNPFQDGRQG